MTVRHYTADERAALSGGLSRPDYEARGLVLERAFLLLCANQPPRAVALAVRALLRRHGTELRDFLDTIDAVCAQQGGRHVPPPRFASTFRLARPRDLPRVLRAVCGDAPLGIVGAAIHGVTCGNGLVRDALDALDDSLVMTTDESGTKTL